MKKYFYIIIMLSLPGIFSCTNIAKDENEEVLTMFSMLKEDERARQMQGFIIDISEYARGLVPGFIIIPQNGEELAFKETDEKQGILDSFVHAIDGFGIEELFYDGRRVRNNGRIRMLNTLVSLGLKIMVADHVSDDSNIPESNRLSEEAGFISFPRSRNNYDYEYIPAGDIFNDNSNDITKLSEAQNYLYLINDGQYRDKNAMLNAIRATNYDVILIDLFFKNREFTKEDIRSLKTKENGGKRLVIAYISVGSAEKYRYYFKNTWIKGNPEWLVKSYPDYPDEFWVAYWHEEWRKIIFGNNQSYIKKIIDAEFDGAYLDNVEAYYSISR